MIDINAMIENMTKSIDPHVAPDNIREDVRLRGNLTVLHAVAIAVVSVLWQYQKRTVVRKGDGEIDLDALSHDLKMALEFVADRITFWEKRRKLDS
jgi:hypothetical protein